MNHSFENIVGGKWWKIDFHLHTPGSYDYGHGDENQKNTTPEDFLMKCMEKQLDCIVVTDHDTFQWIPKLRNALEQLRSNNLSNFRNITIFPGVEINVQGNVHLLGIFDPNEEYENLVKILGSIEVNNETQSTNKAINEVIEIIVKNNGVAIPAHVDGPSGLFKAPATIIKSAFNTNDILALEVLNATFHNGIYETLGLKHVCVLGSDSHTTTTIGDKYTWVKMGVPNIEALRLALYDAQDGAIRSIESLSDPNNIVGRTYIKELKISKGKCIGMNKPYSIQFSPWLNSIIGGRGSGKSSIIKFIRLMLDRKDELPEELLKEYEDFIKVPASRADLGMLRNETAIDFTMVVEGVEHCLHWENNILYENTQNGFIEATSLNTRFPVRLFSQKQLYELTKNPHLLFDYMDAEWDYLAWKEELRLLQDSFKLCQQKIRNLKQKQEDEKRLKVELQDLDNKIAVFETEQTKKVLLERNTLQVCKKKVIDTYEKYSTLLDSISKLRESFIEEQEAEDLSVLDSDTKSRLIIWENNIKQLKIELSSIFDKYAKDFLSFEELFSQLNLNDLINKNNVDMQDVITDLRNAGVDNIDKYAELIERKSQVETQLQQYSSTENELNEQNSLFKKLLNQFDELLKKRYLKRYEVISRWNEKGELKISLELFSNFEANEFEFRKIIRKDNGFDSDILDRDIDTNIPKDGFIYKICKGSDSENIENKISNLRKEKIHLLKLSDDYSKKFTNYMSKTLETYEDTLTDILMWVPNDRLSLEIKINNKFVSVDAGSPGQRTSAILSLIFNLSDSPIIIDQPEDDLDTRNITNIVVNGINRAKAKQQIILVTHNPNIVVNTNSEQVIQLDYKCGQIDNACSGALQDHDVRDAICEVMEGGKEALEKRYFRIFKALSK